MGKPAIDPVQFVEPIRAVRTFETAIDNIISGIERARLRSGDRLPNETELAAQLGISKPTLRQALRVLEHSGLLVVKQGKTGGIFLNSDFLPTHEASSEIEVEERTILEALRARRVIETAVAEEALVTATEDDLDEIERTIDLLVVAGVSSRKVMHADLMFHRAIARASHNRLLEKALQVVYRQLASIRETYQESAQDGAALDLVASLVHAMHSQQLEAIRNRDLEQLRATLDVHFRFLEERFAASVNRSWHDLFDVRDGSAPHRSSPA